VFTAQVEVSFLDLQMQLSCVGDTGGGSGWAGINTTLENRKGSGEIVSGSLQTSRHDGQSRTQIILIFWSTIIYDAGGERRFPAKAWSRRGIWLY